MQLLPYSSECYLVFKMEGFTFGSILASLIASALFGGATYLFVKKKASSVQDNEIDDTEVLGSIEQEIDIDSAVDSAEQHLKVSKSRIEGGISQKISKKKT